MSDLPRFGFDELLPDEEALPDPDAAGLIPTGQIDEDPAELLSRVLRGLLLP